MSREALVFLIGLVFIFLPSLGMPTTWKEYFITGSGVVLVILGYLLRRAAFLRTIDKGNGELETDSFVESRPAKNPELPDLSS